MEFRIVNAERFNVYLTKDELEQKHIDLNRLCDDEILLNQQLKYIVQCARERIQFHADNTPLEVEIVPITDGDLFISVCKAEPTAESLAEQNETFICGMEDIEEVIQLCSRLRHVFRGVSDLVQYQNRYYLRLITSGMTETQIIRTKGILWDYGCFTAHENMGAFENVLLEHGKVICMNNCIDLFTKVFKNA